VKPAATAHAKSERQTIRKIGMNTPASSRVFISHIFYGTSNEKKWPCPAHSTVRQYRIHGSGRRPLGGAP
jgi:hypothetical protein